MSSTATTLITNASLKRGALTLSAPAMLDFALQLLLPVALVRLLPPAAFADYRLAWLAIGAAMAVAPFALPRSLFFLLPRAEPALRAAYVHQSVLLLLLSGLAAGLLLGPWNPILPPSLRAISGAAWFMPAFLTLWVAASLAEFLPNARDDTQGQALVIVALAVLRVAMVAMAAIWGRADIVFGALLAYAAIKLGVVMHHAWRHYGAPASALLSGRYPGALHRQLAYVLPFGLASALFLLPVALVRLLPPAAFADYRLAWLAIGAAMAVAPFALPRSLFYLLPRAEPALRAAYVHQSVLLLLLSGLAA
ncbi:MAG: hypothetical protein H7335_02655, partial [Massilia sp.]|nr:hypothetical protein [Massilia sp.]